MTRVLLASAALALAGCGGGPATATVTGAVVFDGRPVTGGAISFISKDGMPHQADIRSDGTYRVDGVPVGPAIVVLTPPPPADESAAGMRLKDPKSKATPVAAPAIIPARYVSAATSDLTYEVKAGENKYDPPLKP
jgi:hypothetical protein